MQDELGKDLQTLFQEKSQQLAEEPFLGNMLRIVGRRQRRRTLLHGLLWILLFSACAGFSPFLIKGSILISVELDAFIGIVGTFLTTPMGMGAAAVGVLLLWLFKRKWIAAFV